MRDAHRRADARVGRVLTQRGFSKVRQPDASVQRQPGRRLVLVLKKNCFRISPNLLALAEWRIAAITGNDAEELIVASTENLHAGTGIMLATRHSERSHAADVVRS